MSASSTTSRGFLRLLLSSSTAWPGGEGGGDRRQQLPTRRVRRSPHTYAFVVRPGRHSGWRWWLERPGGEQLAAAGRPADSEAEARRATLRVRLAAATAAVETFEDAHGRVQWRLLSGAGALLAVSVVGYATTVAAERAIAAFRREASHAELADG